MKGLRILLFLLLPVCLLAGCTSGQGEGAAGRREIDYTVADVRKLPEELLQVIEENKKGEIRMTYTDGEDMYLIRGYGEQKTGGYSVAVAECSEDETTILFDTRLLGPENPEGLSRDPSYPYVVVKIEAREKEVLIQ